jgi:hypothetical protein
MSDDDTTASQPAASGSTVASLLARTEALAGDSGLAEIAARLFSFTQFLLDDDDNITKVGNLNGEARDKLRARCFELLGVSAPVDAADAADASADAVDVAR